MKEPAQQDVFISPQKAKSLVRWAIARGELVRPEVCSRCGKSPPRGRDGRTMIQAHHADYSKPLDVEFICNQCHRDLTPNKSINGNTAVYGDKNGMRKHYHCRSIGERNGSSKLTVSQVQTIYTSRLSGYAMGRVLGVHHSTISDIRSGKRWGWLKEKMENEALAAAPKHETEE